MNSERFRVRGYDVFLVQGWGKWSEGLLCRTLCKYITCDVTFSLIRVVSYPSFSCPNTEAPCQLFFSAHIFKSDTSPLLFFLFLSSCYLLALHLCFLSPQPSLRSLYFFPFCQSSKTSWGFSLQHQQHSKVKSPKRERFPAVLPITTYCTVLSPWKRDCVQAWLYISHIQRVNRGTVLNNTFTVANVLLWLEFYYTISAVCFCLNLSKKCFRSTQNPLKAQSQCHLMVTRSFDRWTFLSWIQPVRQCLIPSCPGKVPPFKWM